MKQTSLVAGQRWRTYAFDGSLVVADARRSVSRMHHRHDPVDLFPAEPGVEAFVQSDDPRVDQLKIELAHTCSETFQPSFVGKYAGANAVTGNFMAARTDNQPMRQAVLPMPNNTRARADLGLQDEFKSVAHLAILKELAKCMTTGWLPGSIRVAKLSTSGPPLYSSSAAVKKMHYMNVMQQYGMERLLTKIEERDFATLYTDIGMVIAMMLGDRHQADSWVNTNGVWSPKVRLVPDLDYMLTDGARGRLSPADKTCTRNPDLALARCRTYYGMANLANLVMQTAIDGHNGYIFTQYDATFKSRGSSHIEQMVNKFAHHVAVDVSNHDFLVPQFWMRIFFDRLREIWDERLVDLCELAWRAPAWVPSPDVYGEPAPFWLGHPLNAEDFDHWYGVPSGHPFVAITGKFGCVAAYLCKLHDIGVKVLGNIDAILRWEHAQVAMLDTGDDAVICFHHAGLAKRMEEVLDEQDYYSTGVEVPSYLGNVLWKDNITDKIHACPNPISYIVNPLARERGIGGKFHKYWFLGYAARNEVYSTCPIYGALKETYLRAFRDHMGYDLEAAIGSHPDRCSLGDYTTADLLVLDDPSRLAWRFDEAEINADIVGDLQLKITPEEYLGFISPYIKLA